jgi:DHA1 family tetracycline resistance protein-like MFS transporter
MIALGVALSYTMITSLLSMRTDANRQGEVLGINTSVQSLAFALPGIFSGLIASKISADAPILIAAVFIFLAALFVFSSKQFYSPK